MTGGSAFESRQPHSGTQTTREDETSTHSTSFNSSSSRREANLMYLQAIYPYATKDQLEQILRDAWDVEVAVRDAYDVLNPDIYGYKYLREQWLCGDDSKPKLLAGIAEVLGGRAGSAIHPATFANLSDREEYEQTVSVFAIDTSDWDEAYVMSRQTITEALFLHLPLSYSDGKTTPRISSAALPNASTSQPEACDKENSTNYAQDGKTGVRPTVGCAGNNSLASVCHSYFDDATAPRTAPILQWAPRALRIGPAEADTEQHAKTPRLLESSEDMIINVEWTASNEITSLFLSNERVGRVSPSAAHEPFGEARPTVTDPVGSSDKRPRPLVDSESHLRRKAGSSDLAEAAEELSLSVQAKAQDTMNGRHKRVHSSKNRKQQKTPPEERTTGPLGAMESPFLHSVATRGTVKQPTGLPLGSHAGTPLESDQYSNSCSPSTGPAFSKAMDPITFLYREEERWSYICTILSPYRDLIDSRGKFAVAQHICEYVPSFEAEVPSLLQSTLHILASELPGKCILQPVSTVLIELPMMDPRLVSFGAVTVAEIAFKMERCKARILKKGSCIKLKLFIKKLRLEPIPFSYIREAAAAREQRLAKTANPERSAVEMSHIPTVFMRGTTSGELQLSAAGVMLTLVASFTVLSSKQVLLRVSDADISIGTLDVSTGVTKLDFCCTVGKPVVKAVVESRIRESLLGDHRW